MGKPTPPAEDVPDELKQLAWGSFIQWAGNDPDLRAEFTAATGTSFTFKYVGMDRKAIEEKLVAIMHEYVEWATRNHYGLEHAPKAYRDHVESKKS